MEHTQCLICEKPELRNLRRFEKDALCQCVSCGFVFCKPIPTESELAAHYEGYGRNDYLSPVTIKRYHEILDSFEKYRNTNNILDLGCGIGYFLEIAKQRGWTVYGTEYTEKAVDICTGKGIHMHQGVLNPASYSGIEFDIVTSFEVIEHINNPISEIKNINQILRKGGVFYFTTPNFNALERYLLGDDYSEICYPEHLSYYTKSTAHKLLTSYGFEKKYLITTGISITAIRNHFSKKKEKTISSSSTDDKIRTVLEEGNGMQWIKTFINKILDFSNLGNSLKGSYLKK